MAVYGDNCIDRYVRPERADFVGGNAVNVAVHLAAQGVQVAYFGVTGNDAEGAMVREALAERGVDCTHVEVRRGETAVTWIEVREGDRVVLGDSVGAQCPLRLSAESLQALAQYRLVHCSAFTAWNLPWREANPAIAEEIEALAANGSAVSVDFSEQEEPELAALAGRSLRIAFVSRGPGILETRLKETVHFFHDCGTPEVVVTLGSAGCAFSCGSGVVHLPARPITPVDTLGAGDAFIAGWLFGRLQGGDPLACAKRATELAAGVCGHFGAWPSGSITHRSGMRTGD